MDVLLLIQFNKGCYYSFKIFPRFWLVKITRIIHHSQLLLTKFGKNFVVLNRWRQNDVKGAAWLQVIELLNEKNWGRGGVVLVVGTKWRNCLGTFHPFHGEYCLKTSQEQQEGNSTGNICYLEYIWRPKLPDKDALSIWTYIDRG